MDELPDVNLCCKLFNELKATTATGRAVNARRNRSTTQAKNEVTQQDKKAQEKTRFGITDTALKVIFVQWYYVHMKIHGA